jgi:hypothetical protein
VATQDVLVRFQFIFAPGLRAIIGKQINHDRTTSTLATAHGGIKGNAVNEMQSIRRGRLRLTAVPPLPIVRSLSAGRQPTGGSGVL